jgi:transcriptional antiterminator RfaH
MGQLAVATRTPSADDDKFLRAQAAHYASYPIGKHWFCIRTNIKCEYRAQKGLDAIGYRTYLPQRTKWISHARVRTIVKRPLMCRYLFVELDPNKEGFGPTRLVDGVETIVGSGWTPMVIPADFVTELISREMSGEFDDAAEEPIARGAKVKVVSGKWDELIGIVTGGAIVDGLGAVMVKFLNSRTSARFRGDEVRAITRA